MRDEYRRWCEAAGLTVTVDRLGNMFARRPGKRDDLPPVTMGSHLDTQYAGGRFDGILGVLSGLEVIRTLNDAGIETLRPIEVINWTNEEGCRFSPPMASAGAFAGVYTEEFVATRADDDGLLQGEELERIGYRGPAAVGGRPLDAYFELHIEQGPILDAEAIPLGIVTGGYKSFGAHVDVKGETAHAGPTPMEKRRDALVGAARVVAAVNDIGWKHADTLGKATVTRLVAWPNKPGIISEWAQFSLDCRHPDPATAQEMWAEIEAAIPAAAKEANVEMEITTRWEFGNERFDPEPHRAFARRCRRSGCCDPRPALAGRPRCLPRLQVRPDRDDLLTLHRRHHPQRGRGHRPEDDRTGGQRDDARRAGPGQPSRLAPPDDAR